LTLEFGQGRKDVKRELAARCGAVNRLMQTAKTNPFFFQPVHPRNQILDRPPKPIKPPDHQGVTFTKKLFDFRQTGPLGHSAADLVDNDLFAPGPLEGVLLQVKILFVSGYPRILYRTLL
jgi:hypothetical protein